MPPVGYGAPPKNREGLKKLGSFKRPLETLCVAHRTWLY